MRQIFFWCYCWQRFLIYVFILFFFYNSFSVQPLQRLKCMNLRGTWEKSQILLAQQTSRRWILAVARVWVSFLPLFRIFINWRTWTWNVVHISRFFQPTSTWNLFITLISMDAHGWEVSLKYQEAFQISSLMELRLRKFLVGLRISLGSLTYRWMVATC